jgi:DNA-binding beta-propeller fold protein YncE/mono/diheme cytochrome c family protein
MPALFKEAFMIRTPTGRAGALALLALSAAIAPSCVDDPFIELPPTVEPDIEPTPVAAAFTVTLDPEALKDKVTLDPAKEAAVVTGSSPDIELTAYAKRIVKRPGILRVELYFENKSDTALRDVIVTAKDAGASTPFYDFTNDVFAEASPPGPLHLGGIAARGIGRLVVGVPDTGKPALSLEFAGVRTIRRSTTSAPIVVTPDGAEAWAVHPDADVVAVIDTKSDARVAQIAVPGGPSSVAVTPNASHILVASPKLNRVTIIDPTTRAITQTLGEEDGIGREPRHIVVSPDGARAFVSAYVGDTITSLVRSGKRYRVEGSVAVGRRPAALSVTPDSKALLVSHFLPRGNILENEGWISVVSIDPLEKTREIDLHDHLGSELAHCLADTIGINPSRIMSEGSPTQLAGVFLNPAGTEGWTPGTRVGGAPIWERGPNSQQLSAVADARPGEITPPFVYVMDTRVALESETLLSVGGVERAVDDAYLQCERFGVELEFLGRTLIPGAEDQQVNRFPAFPTGLNALSDAGLMRFVGFTSGGRRALLLAYTSDEIAIHDALTHHPASQRHFPLSGSNPTGLAITPDGAKAYVAYESSTFASVIDLSAYADPKALPGVSFVPYEYRDVPEVPATGGVVGSKQLVRHIGAVPDRPAIKEITQVPLVDVDPLEPAIRRGRVLFNSSNPDKYPYLSASRLGACASCHPDGGTDGSAWATMEGERRTLSLRGGVAGRGWLHASGTHVDASEFADVIVRERLGGDLDEADADALARYIARGIPKLQGPRVDEALAAEGKSIFQQKCVSCHGGEKLTSGNPDPKNPYGGGVEKGPALYDIGTAVDDAHALFGTFFESILPPLDAQLFKELRGDRDLGPGDFAQETLDFRPRPSRARGMLKAPSLDNVWDNVVFFHHAQTASIEEAVHYLNQTLMLGMSDADELAVVEYLKTL